MPEGAWLAEQARHRVFSASAHRLAGLAPPTSPDFRRPAPQNTEWRLQLGLVAGQWLRAAGSSAAAGEAHRGEIVGWAGRKGHGAASHAALPLPVQASPSGHPALGGAQEQWQEGAARVQRRCERPGRTAGPCSRRTAQGFCRRHCRQHCRQRAAAAACCRLGWWPGRDAARCPRHCIKQCINAALSTTRPVRTRPCPACAAGSNGVAAAAAVAAAATPSYKALDSITCDLSAFPGCNFFRIEVRGRQPGSQCGRAVGQAGWGGWSNRQAAAGQAAAAGVA
jgi:hypothetical protein